MLQVLGVEYPKFAQSKKRSKFFARKATQKLLSYLSRDLKLMVCDIILHVRLSRL